MLDQNIKKFLAKLSQSFLLFAPQPLGSVVKIKPVAEIGNIDWSGAMPLNSWKEIFLPARERLFDLKKNSFFESKTDYPATACIGINVLDLKAFTLFEQVFGRDAYYQQRRRNLLLVGYSAQWPNDYKKYKVFSHNWEEDILEHLVFDIFIIQLKNDKTKIYSGSEKGQLILEKYGLKNYTHLEFAGAVKEQGPDKKMLELKEKLAKASSHKLWNELDKICLACGKCSIACPTCFCFDLFDKVDPDKNCRERYWGNCFYNDFSKVAGGFKELDTVKKKIYFWYTHKFVRIPHEYSLPGCVGCGRCTRVCPVGIDIAKNVSIIGKIR
ncbi:MAG: 4Fe-4S dicluster domain-containing protein [Patescibacteria group bacterium]